LSKNGRGVTDMEMVRWANEKVKSGGKSSTMKSFKDPSLSNGVFFLDLLNAIKPGYVDYSLVTSGKNEQEKKSNGESCS
jgi:plastin-1